MGATPSDDRARPGKSRDKGKGQAHPDPGDGELTGRVSHYSRRKGFGFIKVKGRKDLFVHISGVQGEPAQVLTKGNQVAFEVEKGRKGPIAVNVRSLSKSH
ncbi:MAG: cold-shock protein [Actinomycetia bacterium]|nr:cold-shock protein [Actinomycetes bacterium]